MHSSYNGIMLNGGYISDYSNIQEFKEEMVAKLLDISYCMWRIIPDDFSSYSEILDLLNKFIVDYKKTMSFEENVPAMEDYYYLLCSMRLEVNRSNDNGWLRMAFLFSELCLYLGTDALVREFEEEYERLKKQNRSMEIFVEERIAQEKQDERIYRLQYWNPGQYR